MTNTNPTYEEHQALLAENERLKDAEYEKGFKNAFSIMKWLGERHGGDFRYLIMQEIISHGYDYEEL